MILMKKLKSKFSLPMIIILITFLTKIINFIKELLLANRFGTSLELDSFIIATTIPVVITGILASAINTALIPVFSNLKSDKEKFSLTNKVITILAIIMGIITIIAIINPYLFLSIIVSNQDAIFYKLTAELFRINSMNIILITVMYTYIALLNIKGNLVVASIIGVVMQIPTTIYLFYNQNPTVQGLSIINVLSVGIQFTIVIIYLRRINYNYKLNYNFRDDNIYSVFKLSGPIFLSNGVYQLNTIVDNFQASKLGGGTIASFNYSNRLNGIIVSLLVQPMILITYPIIAKLASLEDKEKMFWKSYEVLIFLAIFMIPFSIGVLSFSEEIVKLIYGRGNFDINSIKLTSRIMFFSSISIFFLAIKELIVRIFYSLKQVGFITKVSIFSISINIILNILLTPILREVGIIIGTTISTIIFVFITLYELSRNGFKYNLEFVKVSSKLIIFSVISILIPKILMEGKTNYIFIFNVLVASIIYLVLLYIGGKKELNILKNVLISRECLEE